MNCFCYTISSSFACTLFIINDSSVLGAPLSGKTVIVDAGHGGYNPGAIANGSIEKDNNLAVIELSNISSSLFSNTLLSSSS